MRITFIVAFILFYFAGYAQDRKITYFLPDSVEVHINNLLLRSLKLNNNKEYYFLLKEDTSRVYNLTVIPFDINIKTEVSNWVSATNRYALINGRLYPLLFDYDFTFSTPDPNNVGSFGHRDGNIRKLHLIAHSYTIYFKTNGTILKEVYW
jgi:hypothetical protein